MREGRVPAGRAAAIVASIAVHAVAAWGMVALRPAPQPASQRAMSVQLVQAPPLAEPRPPAAPAGSPRRAAAGVRARERVEPAARPAARASPPPMLPGSAAPAASAVPASSASAPPALAAPATPSLEDWRRRVWAHLAARAPTAPPGAGTATVMFGLDEAGAVLFVRLARSSGRPAFDRACLAAVRAAGPLPAPPAEAGPADLVFSLPIRAAGRSPTPPPG